MSKIDQLLNNLEEDGYRAEIKDGGLYINGWHYAEIVDLQEETQQHNSSFQKTA
jgi:hypothetical protein